MKRQLVLTEHVEGESEARQAETLKETQGAEHGDVHREGNTQTKHQHEKHRKNQHGVSTKPWKQRGRKGKTWHKRLRAVTLRNEAFHWQSAEGFDCSHCSLQTPGLPG